MGIAEFPIPYVQPRFDPDFECSYPNALGYMDVSQPKRNISRPIFFSVWVRNLEVIPDSSISFSGAWPCLTGRRIWPALLPKAFLESPSPPLSIPSLSWPDSGPHWSLSGFNRNHFHIVTFQKCPFATPLWGLTLHRMKRCSTSVVIRELQITTRYHYTPIKMATIKNSDNTKRWRGCGQAGSFIRCWWECKMVQLWKKVWQFLKKT